MKAETITIKKLTAAEGHYLTDGTIYGKVIYLAQDKAQEEFHEVTEEEYGKLAEEEV